jgi:hypothetical protein
MAVHYDGLKLTWLSQKASNTTSLVWIAPPEGDIGSFNGGTTVLQPIKVRVDNGPSPSFTIANGTLPLGLTIDPNNGAINGILNNVDGSYFFTLRASSGGNTIDRDFSANVSVNLPPVWNTPSGSLGTEFETRPVSIALSATDPESKPVTFSIASGSLPGGLHLFSNGAISGTLTNVTDDTVFFFTIAASDGINANNQAFQYTVQYSVPPTWVMPVDGTGRVGSAIEGFPFSYTFEADSTSPLTYTFAGGNPPAGLSIDANTGIMSGTLGAVAFDTTYYFNVQAFDGLKGTDAYANMLVYKNVPPNWISSGTIFQGFGGNPFSVQLQASDPHGANLTYYLDNSSTLPDGITLSNTGVVAGTLPVVVSQTDYNFTAIADNGLKNSPRSLKIRDFVNQPPQWVTGSSLGTFLENTAVNVSVQAIDPAGLQTISYSVDISTPLPTGLMLNGSTGLVYGTASTVTQDTDYTFNLIANNGILSSTQNFDLVVKFNTPPVWNTNAGLIGNTVALYDFTFNLHGSDAETSVTYSLANSTSLPSGLGLSSGGLIHGESTAVDNTTQTNFTVALSDGYNPAINRDFSIIVTPNLPPIWITNTGVLGSAFETAPFTYQLQAFDPEGQPISYYLAEGEALPSGLKLSGTGLIAGSLPNVPNDITTNFVVYADDGTPNQQSRVVRSFSIVTLFNSPPVWTTSSLPNGIENNNYSYQLTATGVGNGPMIYTLNSGVLPAGLTLSKSGLISGTMPVANTDTTYSFDLFAWNGIKGANQDLTLTVEHNLPPVWTTNSGTIGSFFGGNVFSVPIVAVDPNGTNVTYSLANGTTLPSGVTLSSSGAVNGIFGESMNSITHSFTVSATDGVNSVYRDFSIVQMSTVAPNWVTPPGSLGQLNRGQFFNQKVAATDPQHLTVTYAMANSTVLPPGFTINANTGLIVGYGPDVPSNTDFDFTVSADNGFHSTNQDFSISIVAVRQPIWQTPSGALGSVLSGYSGNFPLSATDPDGFSLTYSITAGSLPPSMGINPSSGLISGTTLVTNTTAPYNFTVTADSGFSQSPRSFLITVDRNTAPVWNTPPGDLGSSNENNAISIALSATDPEGQAIAYTQNGGTLPTGLSLSGTGVFGGTTGTVSNTTTYNFGVDASDGLLKATESFSYTINFSSPPTWVTPSGSLGSQLEQTFFTANVSATSAGQAINYTVANGSSLPSGLLLNANTGQISGTLPPVSVDTPYPFTLLATSLTSSKSTPQNFSITDIHHITPVWSNTTTNIESDLAGTAFSVTLVAISPNGIDIEYVIASGSLPDGVSFNPNGTDDTCTISGVLPTVAEDTTYPFSLGANDGFSQVNHSYSITSWFDQNPIWVTNAGSIGEGIESTAFSNTVVAHEVHGRALTYTLTNGSVLPSGLTLQSNGHIFGALPLTNGVTNGYTFSVNANSTTLGNTQTFSITVDPHLAPVWNTNAGLIANTVAGTSFTFHLSATSPQSYGLTYTLGNSTTLPSGLTMMSNGYIFGITAPVLQDTFTNFSVLANDGTKSTYNNMAIDVLFNTQFEDALANTVTLLVKFDN